jgi:hypothetical protein
VSNTFRKQYGEKPHVALIKDTAEKMEAYIERALHTDAYTPEEKCERERQVSLALTNLEQAVMWAVKAAT